MSFEAFFRRIKAGETPGYPRFKSLKRFAGWGYKTYGDGWKLRTKVQGDRFTYDKLYLTGIGDIRIRGQGRFLGTPKTCEILHKQGQWHLSVTFDVPEHQIMRPSGTQAMTFDWGLNALLTIAKSDGTLDEIDNPRWLKANLSAIKNLARAISAEETRIRLERQQPADWKLPPACQSRYLKRLYVQLRNIHGKLARQRKDFYHKLTTALVEQCGALGTEALAVANMVKRPKARPDPEQPGEFLPNRAAQKAGLNRGILDAAPSMLLGQLAYKAEEAGYALAVANTRVVKPTQRCHRCGVLVPKTLDEREHRCACGCHCGRDENAAKTLLRWMLEGSSWFAGEATALSAKPSKLVSGREPAGAPAPETPPIAAQAAWAG